MLLRLQQHWHYVVSGWFLANVLWFFFLFIQMVMDSAMGRSSPSASLISKRILASPASYSVSAAAPLPSPESVAAGGAASAPLSMTPEVPIACQMVASPPWRGDEMRHRPMMTPPVSVAPEQMITPDATQTYTHVSNRIYCVMCDALLDY